MPTGKKISDAEYDKFVDRLIQNTISALLDSKRNNLEAERGIRDYLTEAYEAGLSISEVVDFFCVSSENIAERVSRNEEESKALIAQFDAINNEVSAHYFK